MKKIIIIILAGCLLNGEYVNNETKLCGIPERTSNQINLDQEGGITAQFFINNPEESKPSKPLNFLSSVNNYHPHLQWSPNIEPDLQGYILYKFLETQDSGTENFSFFLQPNVTSFTDVDFDIKKRRLDLDRVAYWLVAIDDQGLESDPTEEKPFTGMSRTQWRQTISMDEDPLLYYPLRPGNVRTYRMIYTDSPYRSIERVVRDSIAAEGRYVWANETAYNNSGNVYNYVNYYFIDTLHTLFSSWINPCSLSLSAHLGDTTSYFDTTYNYHSGTIVEAVDTVLIFGDSISTKAYSLWVGGPGQGFNFYYMDLAYGLGPLFQTGETMGEIWLTGAYIDGVLYGDTTLLSVSDGNGEIPTTFALHPAYPNPFNPVTTIRFLVETLRGTSLQVFDVSGRLVETLVDGELPTGEHEIVWNANKHPSGVYFVRLQSGELFETQKVVLMK